MPKDAIRAFEAYTRCHPENMDTPHTAQARNGWWNGVNVLVRDPETAFRLFCNPAPVA
jgi:hypothetical protein